MYTVRAIVLDRIAGVGYRPGRSSVPFDPYTLFVSVAGPHWGFGLSLWPHVPSGFVPLYLSRWSLQVPFDPVSVAGPH